MSEHGSYGQFCPVAMAAEIFCSRWTPLILREMYCGTTRFNDLRRGVPRMSPSLLSKRLVEMREAGIIEEAAFRGYMQGPIERRYGLLPAILITGTMFAVAHLDFTLILWPYYVAVAAIYGTVTHLTKSILPAVVLHTAGNLYSNLDLWIHGQAEWQAASVSSTLIWKTGADPAFWIASGGFVVVAAATLWAYSRLARAAPSLT